MAEILDQSEVDALLSAIAADETPVRAAPVARRSTAARETRPEAVAYDFKRPERVSKDQMRVLQSMHEGFARNFGASLSALLRTIVEARVATAEQLTYSEFIHSLPSPTCFNLVSAPPLEGQMCLEISPLIVFPIIDRLLGGSNAEMFVPQRALTTIESRLMQRILDRALSNLSEAWAELVEVKFELTGSESNPHLVQIVAPNEVVVVLGYEIKMGARAGTMSFCIPFNVIEPVIGKLAPQSWLAYSRGGASPAQTRQVTENLRRAKMDVRAYLGETTLTVAELLSLAPGDVIQLDKLTNREFQVRVEGQNKFAGKLGRLRGNRAVQITRHSRHDEPL